MTDEHETPEGVGLGSRKHKEGEMSDERGSDETTPTVGIDDDVIAWFTDDFADAAKGIQERARELGHRIRSLGREHPSVRRDRIQLFRMISLLCRMAHIIFADLDMPQLP